MNNFVTVTILTWQTFPLSILKMKLVRNTKYKCNHQHYHPDHLHHHHHHGDGVDVMLRYMRDNYEATLFGQI